MVGAQAKNVTSDIYSNTIGADGVQTTGFSTRINLYNSLDGEALGSYEIGESTTKDPVANTVTQTTTREVSGAVDGEVKLLFSLNQHEQ